MARLGPKYYYRYAQQYSWPYKVQNRPCQKRRFGKTYYNAGPTKHHIGLHRCTRTGAKCPNLAVRVGVVFSRTCAWQTAGGVATIHGRIMMSEI